MSMHDMEAFAEEAVSAVARSGIPLQEKRDLIFTLFWLEGMGDTGFTNLRTIDDMVSCHYTFLFHKEEMSDYESNRHFYDTLQQKGSFEQGDIYDHGEMLCVDSGSPAWEAMIAAEKITGVGALPVHYLHPLEALFKVKQIIDRQIGKLDEYTYGGFLTTLALAKDEIPPNGTQANHLLQSGRFGKNRRGHSLYRKYSEAFGHNGQGSATASERAS